MKYINFKKLKLILLSGFVITTLSGSGSTEKSINYSTDVIEETNDFDNDVINNILLKISNIYLKIFLKNLDRDYSTNVIEEEYEFDNDAINNILLKISNIYFKIYFKDKNIIYNNGMMQNQQEQSINAIELSYKNKDKTILNYFNETKENIKTAINSENLESVEDKIFKEFINMTDFIFFDKEINGITYNELKNETKLSIKETYFEIDQLICLKYPNYKENIGSRYNDAKEWLNKKYNHINEKTKNSLSDESKENLDILKNDVDNLKKSLNNSIDSIYEDEKVKVKIYYDGIKSNNRY